MCTNPFPLIIHRLAEAECVYRQIMRLTIPKKFLDLPSVVAGQIENGYEFVRSRCLAGNPNRIHVIRVGLIFNIVKHLNITGLERYRLKFRRRRRRSVAKFSQ